MDTKLSGNARPDGAPAPGLIQAVWRYRWLVVGATLSAAVLAFAASFLQTTMYRTEARLLLEDPGEARVFGEASGTRIDAARFVRNQAELVRSSAVAARAVELLGGRLDVEELSERVTAEPSVDLDLVVIRALDPTAEGAAEVANAVAEAYQDEVRDDVMRNAQAAIDELEEQKAEIQQRIDAAEARLAADPEDSASQAARDAAVSQLITIEGRADQIGVEASLYGAGVALFEPADPPESAAQPKPLRNAAVAAVLGLLGISAFAWWRAEHAQSAERRQDAAPVLGAPLLGEIPDFRAVGITDDVPTRSAPRSVAAEAYQFVVSSLEFAVGSAGGRSILLTSAGPGDGKTTTSLNLAVAAAKDGRKVLLVDADERMRGLTRMSGVTPSPGLTDLGDEDLPFEGCVSSWRVGQDVTLPFIPGGSSVADSAGFFRTLAFRTAMQRIKEQADFLLVDSPPLLAVSDTSAIASHVDGIVVVVARGTPFRQLEDVRQRLSFIGTPLLGYVFNRGVPRAGGYGYGYYGSAYGDAAELQQPPSDGGQRRRWSAPWSR